jgi:glycine C-acetyltransferase
MSIATRVDPLSFLTDQLDELKAKGTHFKLRVLDDEQAAVCTFDGKRVINLASNNYLGFATHPKLREAALEATRKYGVGSGAVRTIAGTMKIHMELEEKIARFKNVEACVVFQSGFTANAGTVSSFLGKEDFIISDELNHASIIDGCRLSRAKILVFRHKDVAHAEEQLASVKNQPGKKLLITDGVFSMDGDIGPLPGLCEAAEKYGAIMMVDDAHSSGVLGRQGRGTIDHFGMHGRVDIQVGTLSKAIAALGGYVCGTRDLIDFLYHRARPFLFSTSHPPSVAATCIAAFDVLETEPQWMEQLWANTRFWKKELGLLGFNIGGQTTPASETPITPIIIGDGRLTMDFSHELFKEGVLGTGIAFPTVPEGKARVRTIVTATHTKDELQQALAVLWRVGKKIGIVG